MRTITKVLTAMAFVFSPMAHAAEEWGIEGEEVVRIGAVVVDVACELSGDCPADCGAGKRQLGLLTNEDTLLLVVKNNDIFAGGTNDLVEFCGKEIVADGLLITSVHMPLFALQFKRLAPDGKWSRANQFTKDWSNANGGKKGNQWFRNDAVVNGEIATNGVFGIPGLEPEEE